MKHISHFLSETSHKLLLISITLFTILRFPSLFEPYWYGDEGIYQVIAKGINRGLPLYEGVWDNKPPLLYLIYALFDGDQFFVRLFSLIVGIVTVVLFYEICKLLLRNQMFAGLLTIFFAVLFASPYLEGNIANAENFMLLPIMLGVLFIIQHILSQNHTRQIWVKNSTVSFLLGGFCFGISFMTKIVGVFDLFAVLMFLFVIHPFSKETYIRGLIILVGFAIPVVSLSLYFLLTNSFNSYLTAIFFSNVSYVGYENFLIIPQGLLVLKFVLLALLLIIVFLKRTKLQYTTIFIVLWVSFSLFSSFFSHRSYTHYILLSLPGLLLLGALVYKDVKKHALFAACYLLLLGFLIFHFKPFPLIKSVTYYGNFVTYLLGINSVYNYQLFFDKDVPRDYEIAEYIDMKLDTNEEIFIYGNSAQIYVLSETLPINRYTVAYHINSPSAISEVQDAINTKRPRFVVILSDQRLGSLYLPNYVYRMNLNDTAIYEYFN